MGKVLNRKSVVIRVDGATIEALGWLKENSPGGFSLSQWVRKELVAFAGSTGWERGSGDGERPRAARRG